MRFARTLSLLSVAAVAASALAAPKVVGAWTGRIVIKADLSTVPAQQRPMVSQILSRVQKTKLSINLRANKTFIETATPPEGASQSKEGTWGISGNQILLVASKINGKPAPKGLPNETLVVSKDGKSLSIALPTRGGVSGKINFTR